MEIKTHTSRTVMPWIPCFLAALALALMLGATASAGDFFFSTGDPDGRIASVSHPESRGKTEHESADDFILTSRTELRHAAFTGVLFHGGRGEIRDVVLELYHVFPKDSNATRTPECPTGRIRLRINGLMHAAARMGPCSS